MNRNEIIEQLARSILETTERRDQIEANVDRDLEQLGDDVQAKCAELAPEYFGKSFLVPLIKQVFEKADPENVRRIRGRMRVTAMFAEEAREIVEAEMKEEGGDGLHFATLKTLQTVDPRIVWDYGDLPYDAEYGCIDGWEYVDFSFGLDDIGEIEEAPHPIYDATYVSQWDGGITVQAPCKFDADLMRVFDIEANESVDGVDVLEAEYIETDDGGRLDKSEVTVCP